MVAWPMPPLMWTGVTQADVESFVEESFLDGMGDLLALGTEGVSFGRIDDFHTLDVAQDEGHRKALGVHLAAQVTPQVIDYGMGTGHETADGSHALCKCSDVQVNPVHAVLLL